MNKRLPDANNEPEQPSADDFGNDSSQEGIEKRILPIQETVLKIMTFLIDHGAAEEEVMDYLRDIELDYFSVLEKLKFIEEQSNIDSKTNLLKYRPDYLKNIVKTSSRLKDTAAHRERLQISYCRFDIDDFSRLNNTYGHEFGDQVLIDISYTMRGIIRPTDYAIRFGGEELDIILPFTDLAGAESLVERLMEAVRNLNFRHNRDRVRVTMSGGIATVQVSLNEYYEKMKDPNTLTAFWETLNRVQNQADCACYDAKNSGKNCHRVYSEEKDYEAIRRAYANSR